jgi:hypothetical protein
MMMRTRLGIVALLAFLLLLSAAFPVAAAEAQPPRLIVLVVFDQLRGDYLTRWQQFFGKDGFNRLLTQGAWFPNCHYPYAGTITAAGHASLVSGCYPSEHSVVGNDWRDRKSGEEISCVASGHYERVPPLPPSVLARNPKAKKGNASPGFLRAPTLGDALKEATGDKGRVFSLSLKDRSAILPAGQHPDACYWFDENTGDFVTSTYYRDRLHPWVAAYNGIRAADAWFDQIWNRYLPDRDYTPFSGPDDMAGEGKGSDQGRVFPHPMHGRLRAPNVKYYTAVAGSPFGNELLYGLACRAIEAEHLGQGPATDFLSISFSSNDLIGHVWGPDSHEVMDVTLRSDDLMHRLLTYLDAHVGRGRYVLAMTADHGICPLPEVARSHGLKAGRVSPRILMQDATTYLDERFGLPPHKASWFAGKPDLCFYLNPVLLRANGLNAADVETALAGWVRTQPGVQTTYTRQQLLEGVPATDALGVMVRRSFDREHSGDVALILKPYYLLSEPLATGTTHGSPHAYDTHVPLLFYGTGIHAGTHSDRVSPLITAAVLAQAAKIKPPARAQVFIPVGIF